MRLFQLLLATVASVVVATLISTPATAKAYLTWTPEIIQSVKDYEKSLEPPAAPVVVPEAPPIAPRPPTPDPAVVEYILKNTPPDELIRYYFRDTSPAVIERMLFIACREGGMGKDRTRNLGPKEICLPQNRVPAVPFDPSCGADNLHSSASGLFQYLDDWAGWGGYDWGLIVNRDCLEDVRMTRAVWNSNGFGPWS